MTIGLLAAPEGFSSAMITININHAFDGFLYAPLYLASELGLFPKCARLAFRNGDSECLDALCGYHVSGEENWFAICDPFSLDISSKVPEQRDDICVVGCLIDKLPVWVYNPDPSIQPVKEEDHLKRYNGRIKTLISYKEGTTGYLIGKRLKQSCFSESNLVTADFGSEFDAHVDNTFVIVTSDLLRIVHNGLNDRKIIFNYPSRSPKELSPFLFTAILTLKRTVVDENLWAVLTLLAGLKQAIDLLRHNPVAPEYVKILTECFQSKLSSIGVTTRADQELLIERTITYAFQTVNLYSETLRPEKAAWDKAKKQWVEVTGSAFADTEELAEPIPALLIKRGWRHNAELRGAINADLIDVTSVLKSDKLRLLHKVAPLGCILLSLLFLFTLLTAFVEAPKPLSGNSVALIVVASFAWCIQAWHTLKLCRDLARFKTDNFTQDFLTAFGIGALVIGVIEWIA